MTTQCVVRAAERPSAAARELAPAVRYRKFEKTFGCYQTFGLLLRIRRLQKTKTATFVAVLIYAFEIIFTKKKGSFFIAATPFSHTAAADIR